MKGLIIKEPWINFILNGEKTWEIRGSNTKIRGKIYLIKSGTGMMFGECDLADSFPVTFEIFIENKHKHRIPNNSGVFIQYKNPHVWVMQNPVRYPEPKPYEHKQGAIIWINIQD